MSSHHELGIISHSYGHCHAKRKHNIETTDPLAEDFETEMLISSEVGSGVTKTVKPCILMPHGICLEEDQVRELSLWVLLGCACMCRRSWLMALRGHS